jgi:hypothetical protein
MNTSEIATSLRELFTELVNGTPESGGYVLNPRDTGLLRSLDRLSATAASAVGATGSSIAAHVRHLTYALSLLNRWSRGENPWGSADWAASWKRAEVSEPEWKTLLDELRREAEAWASVLQAPREVDPAELNGMIGSVAHLAYHLGAIRQIDPATRGPVSQ